MVGHNAVAESPSVPFRQFIVKIHGRCDLACDYCYVYTMADQRWRLRPRVMSRSTVEQVAIRIAEHARAHGLRSVDVVLHGGEPLLAGAERIEHCVDAIRSAAGSGLAVRLGLQTNGTLLGRHYLRLFDRLGVRVGVSLDGDRAAHDRHRRDGRGQGSHAQVSAGLRLLAGQAYRHLFSGLLCTIDLGNDPVRCYEALLEFDPPTVDFLLPHGTWSAPPPGRQPGSPHTPYADWLGAVFERWYGAGRQETSVRLFDSLIALLLGGRSAVEGVGMDPVPVVVVQTDGAIERSDLLAAAYEGAARTGLHVARDPFDGLDAGGTAALPAGCQGCAVHRVCGGGLLAHRYRAGAGFGNPSVYCPDLYALVRHVRRRLATDVAALRNAAP